MKFTVERDALAEAVAWVARALPARPVIPVLAGMALRAEGDGLTLSCFDYEVSALMRIPGEVAEPGTVLIPGRLLAEITRSLPGLPVSVADDPDGVSMSCGEASFTVATLPSGDYPAPPDLPQLAGTVDGGALAVAIAQVTPAASRDDTLPMLTAVNLELGAGTMTLAATDRYRLAVRELAWYPAPRIAAASDGAVTRGRGAPGPESVLVPARMLADAARMMSPGTAVRIMLRDGSGDAGGPGAAAPVGGADGNGAMIGFEAGGRRLTTRLLAGEFIRYRSRFPGEFGCVADLPAAAFAEALRRVSLVAERGTPVQLSFGPDRVSIGAGTLGQARARETVPAVFTGDEPVIAFNPHYLLDGVIAATASAAGTSAGTSAGSPAPGRAAGTPDAGEAGTPDAGGAGVARGAGEASSPRVRIGFTSPSKPAVITACSPAGPEAGDEFRYLVVPQRLAR